MTFFLHSFPFTGAPTGVGPPSISSLDHAIGDTAGGGQSIVITGTDLGSASSVTFDGVSATITANTSSTITVTLPAHAAGVVDVEVTTPEGTDTAVGAFEYWTPAQITDVQLYLDSDKGVTEAAGEVSAWLDQSASARNFTQATGANKPIETAAVFGSLPSIRFTPQQWVRTTSSIDAIGPYSMFAVVKTASTDATVTESTYNTPIVVGGGNGGWGHFGMSNGEIAAKLYNSALQTRGSGLNDDAPHLIGFTCAAGPTYKFYLQDVQQGADSTPGGTALWYLNQVGAGFNDVDGWDGDLGAVIVSSSVIPGGELTKLAGWSAQRFGA